MRILRVVGGGGRWDHNLEFRWCEALSLFLQPGDANDASFLDC